jgi:hypothetical protein
MASSGYEFSTSQNELIGDLAKKMNFVATLLIAIGILGIFLGIVNIFNALSASEKTAIVVNNLIQGVFSVLVGTWTKNPDGSYTMNGDSSVTANYKYSAYPVQKKSFNYGLTLLRVPHCKSVLLSLTNQINFSQ